VISALIIGAGLALVVWLSNRLLRWARSGGRGAHVLGSVLTEVTQSAVVREAKRDQKRKGADGGDPPERMVTHTGGCHCGRVRFEVVAPARIEVTDCDCSICSKSGYLHLIVPKSRFKLLSGVETLTTYEFNTKTAKHLFCSVCGIKAFYVPRSHPDGYSVNARCLDEGTVEQMTVSRADGKDWEKTYASARSTPLE
jgi:hypothetical protein